MSTRTFTTRTARTRAWGIERFWRQRQARQSTRSIRPARLKEPWAREIRITSQRLLTRLSRATSTAVDSLADCCGTTTAARRDRVDEKNPLRAAVELIRVKSLISTRAISGRILLRADGILHWFRSRLHRLTHKPIDQDLPPKPKGKHFDILDPLWRTRASPPTFRTRSGGPARLFSGTRCSQFRIAVQMERCLPSRMSLVGLVSGA